MLFNVFMKIHADDYIVNCFYKIFLEIFQYNKFPL